MDNPPNIRMNERMLEVALANALRAITSPGNDQDKDLDARAKFYALHKRESDEFGREFVKQYDEDLNTTLIFAGLFSAVATAFIVAVQPNLAPDYSHATAYLLSIYILQTTNISIPSPPAPGWNDISFTAVNVQALLYLSLSMSLLAAFGAMLGKQWLNRYHRVEKRGSNIHRSHDRQRKLDGMRAWYFDAVLEGLPVIQQLALGLHGCALSLYLWDVNGRLAAVVIGVTLFGVVFYIFIVVAATTYSSCPFKTPVSLFLCSLIKYDRENTKFIINCQKHLSTMGRLLASMTHMVKRKLRPTRRNPCLPENINMDDDINVVESLFEGKEVDWEDHKFDAKCINWMLETSNDPDVVISTMKFIPDVEWHSDIETIPSLVRLNDTLRECFRFIGSDTALRSGMKEHANIAARAFLHLYIQRSCLENGEPKIRQFNSKARSLGWGTSDSELKSTLQMIDKVVGKDQWVSSWGDGKLGTLPLPHITWMARLLLYRCWEFCNIRNDTSPPDYTPVWLFLEDVFPPSESLPRSVIADCLLMMGLTLRLPLDIKDLCVVDKSYMFGPIIKKLYMQLNRVFQNVEFSGQLEHALKVLRILLSWKNEIYKDSSVTLCQGIIRSSLHGDSRWEAARLALQIGSRDGISEELFIDPTAFLAFLGRHFALEQEGEYHYESIADGFEALCRSSCLPIPLNPSTTKEYFNPWICSALKPKPDKPFRLRQSTVLFIYWVRSRFLASGMVPIDDPEQRAEFCADLTAVGNEMTFGDHFIEFCYLDTLLAMAESDLWRPHMLINQWRTLEHLSSRRGDPDPCLLDPYLANQDILLSLVELDNWAAVEQWLKAAWKHFEGLTLDVQDQVKDVTRRLFLRKGSGNELRSLPETHLYDLGRKVAPIHEPRYERTGKQWPAEIDMSKVVDAEDLRERMRSAERAMKVLQEIADAE